MACALELTAAAISCTKIFTRLTLQHPVMEGGAHGAPLFPELMWEGEAFSVVHMLL